MRVVWILNVYVCAVANDDDVRGDEMCMAFGFFG